MKKVAFVLCSFNVFNIAGKCSYPHETLINKATISFSGCPRYIGDAGKSCNETLGLMESNTIMDESNCLFGAIFSYDFITLTFLPLRPGVFFHRSEEHTSELQSRGHLVFRLLLEKRK